MVAHLFVFFFRSMKFDKLMLTSILDLACQIRVKSGHFGKGKFGHTFANSENPDETAHYMLQW